MKDEKGVVGNWGIEMNPASLLARVGWKSTTIKPGDKVSITVYPLRNNEKGGQYVSIKLPDGKTLGERPDGVSTEPSALRADRVTGARGRRA